MAPNKRTFQTDLISENQPTTNEYLFKILVIGDLASGKTSFIRRYVHQLFSTHYRATIGVDFALKVIQWDNNQTVRLQLWDIAGQERFGSMTRVYYKDAYGALIFFDISKISTFEAVKKWKEDIDQKVQMADGSTIPCVLVAHKCDLPKEEPFNNTSFLDQFCQEQGFVGWYFTSSKETINVEETASLLVSEILRRSKNAMNNGMRDEDAFSLDDTSIAGKSSKSCAC